MSWINTEEMMPPQGLLVLLEVSGWYNSPFAMVADHDFYLGSWLGDKGWLIDDASEGCEHHITNPTVHAWMPLPKHFAKKELGFSEDETDMMEHAMFEEDPKCLYRTEKMSYQDNWDTRTALKCQLPKIIPNACGDCRDQKFCEAGHGKQISFDDLVGGEE